MGDREQACEALWNTICYAADLLAGKCSIYLSKQPIIEGRIRSAMPMPETQPYKLMEALSILAILIKADSIISTEVFNILGRTGPVKIIEDNQNRFLWTQVEIEGDTSFLNSRPDIIITSSEEQPSSSNIIRIIECKSGKNIGAPIVRSEFGKAYDLKVSSYLIWSYHSPKEHVIKGAKRLGLDLEPLGFDSKMRDHLIQSPGALLSHVMNTEYLSRKKEGVYHALSSSTEKIESKRLLS